MHTRHAVKIAFAKKVSFSRHVYSVTGTVFIEVGPVHRESPADVPFVTSNVISTFFKN